MPTKLAGRAKILEMFTGMKLKGDNWVESFTPSFIKIHEIPGVLTQEHKRWLPTSQNVIFAKVMTLKSQGHRSKQMEPLDSLTSKT